MIESRKVGHVEYLGYFPKSVAKVPEPRSETFPCSFSLASTSSFPTSFKASQDSLLQKVRRLLACSRLAPSVALLSPSVLSHMCGSQSHLQKVTVTEAMNPRGWKSAVPRNTQSSVLGSPCGVEQRDLQDLNLALG